MEALRPAVTGLIAAAGYLVLKTVLIGTVQDGDGILSMDCVRAVYGILFGLLRIKPLQRIHPIVYIAAGAVFGVVFTAVSRGRLRAMDHC